MPHWIALATVVCLAWPRAALAAPTLGFVENWPGTTLSSWLSSLAVTRSNPGTGGFSGIGDGFLKLSAAAGTNFGAYSAGPEYAGDWTAAGITQVRVQLSDLATANSLEIHFGLGRDVNTLSPDFWQYNIGFIPPLNAWGEYVVDLTTATNWTRIIGTTPSATFASALSDCQKILLRHDLAPFMQSPDLASGDLGIDHLLLTNGTLGVEPPAHAFGLERVTPLKLAAAGVAFAGIAAIFHDQIQGAIPVLPFFAVLAAATAGSLGTVLLKRGPHQSPFCANAWGALVGLPLCLGASFALGEPHPLPRTAGALIPLLYLTLAGSVGAYVLVAWLVQRWPVTRISFIAVLIPLIAILLGWMVRGERLPAASFAGSALVVAGVGLAIAGDRLRARTPGPPRVKPVSAGE